VSFIEIKRLTSCPCFDEKAIEKVEFMGFFMGANQGPGVLADSYFNSAPDDVYFPKTCPQASPDETAHCAAIYDKNVNRMLRSFSNYHNAEKSDSCPCWPDTPDIVVPESRLLDWRIIKYGYNDVVDVFFRIEENFESYEVIRMNG